MRHHRFDLNRAAEFFLLITTICMMAVTLRRQNAFDLGRLHFWGRLLGLGVSIVSALPMTLS